jgi:hypothetical protein
MSEPYDHRSVSGNRNTNFYFLGTVHSLIVEGNAHHLIGFQSVPLPAFAAGKDSNFQIPPTDHQSSLIGQNEDVRDSPSPNTGRRATASPAENRPQAPTNDTNDLIPLQSIVRSFQDAEGSEGPGKDTQSDIRSISTEPPGGYSSSLFLTSDEFCRSIHWRLFWCRRRFDHPSS